MDQKSLRLGGILLLSIGLGAGCASANTASDDVDSDEFVEMVVVNSTSSLVTAWGTGTFKVFLNLLALKSAL